MTQMCASLRQSDEEITPAFMASGRPARLRITFAEMIRYTLKRLLSLLISLAVASLVIFIVIEIAPGDPASFMLGINAQPETLAALRTELGLDQSKVERYLSWVGGMLTGDLGTSYTYRTPVVGMVGDRLWVSLPLALYALVLSTAVAFPAGIYAASVSYTHLTLPTSDLV